MINYEISKKLAKGLINKLYTNVKACGSPANTRKRQLLQILETAFTHATEYNEKMNLHSKI